MSFDIPRMSTKNMSIQQTHRKTTRESKRVTTPHRPLPPKKKRKVNVQKKNTEHEEGSNGGNEGQTIRNTKNE